MQKEKVIEIVEKELKNFASKDNRIAKVFLFGSLINGNFWEESDVDVLMLVFRDKEEIYNKFMDDFYDLSLKIAHYIDPHIYTIYEFVAEKSLFLKKVKSNLKEVWSMSEKELFENEAKDLLLLAEEYKNMAENLMEIKKYRGVCDLAYNCIELCAKALILLKAKSIPKTHKGVISQFGKLYVATDEAEKELGRNLSKCFDKRNKARYEPLSEIKEEDAKLCLKTAGDFIKLLKERLKIH